MNNIIEVGGVLMPSFDVVSKTDLMEIDNVINGTMRETKQRFDLAGSKCEITRLDNTLTMIADDTMKLTQLTELLRKYTARREVEQKSLVFLDAESASGGTLRQKINIVQGIDGDLARKITKAVRSSKIKVQVSTQGSELRVSGKNRDDLQSTINFIKDLEIDQPLQYINFRE